MVGIGVIMNNMNKSFVLKTADQKPKWRLFDATGKVLGRLSTEIAFALRGKDKPEFTPHSDAGDYVIVINSDKIHLTGEKWDKKVYERHTGYIGGLKFKTAKEMKTTDMIIHSVKGMLPKNKLSRQILKKLKVYTGSEHPHQAQMNTK